MMKIAKQLVVAVGVVALATSAFAATAPTTTANPAGTVMTAAQADKCAKFIAQAMKKDAHQDAKGQKEIDKFWLKFFGTTVGAPQYEGSTRDMMQDQKLQDKLNEKLRKMGCPI